MKSPRLPGVWFYERATTDCLCTIVTAGRMPLHIGEDLFCEEHKRIATVTAIAPATLEQQDRLLGVTERMVSGDWPRSGTASV